MIYPMTIYLICSVYLIIDEQSLAKVSIFWLLYSWFAGMAVEDQNQLNNKQKIYKLETFASDW